MTVRLFDSKTGAVRDFEPLVPGEVRMYVCGPTVQSSPHVGHLRSALSYDLWRRWLNYRGYRVTFVRNVTDIDDKILVNASEHEPWWALGYRVEQEFSAAYRAIGLLAPTLEPRATGNLPQMITLIGSLIERGHAYVADDGSADVYFDTASWPSYGELTRQSPGELADAAEHNPAKRNPADFALWKGAKAGEPASASWPTPWGSGRPGWHIECSAMAVHYLGTEFDIHGGGLDLRFPHHENELAQSQAAGHGFARYWVHNGLVTVGGQKMSKSLGNSVFASELLSEASPLTVRYLLSAAHYRSTLDIGEGSLSESQSALERLQGFVARAEKRLVGSAELRNEVPRVPEAFASAMDDDLGVPSALGVLHEAVSAGNKALEAGNDAELAVLLGEVHAMLAILGLDQSATPALAGEAAHALEQVMPLILEQRSAARASGDYPTADRIREALAAAGIKLDDSPSGTEWSLS